MDITSVLRTKIKFPVRLKASEKFFEQASGLGFLGAAGILAVSLALPALSLISINTMDSAESSFADTILVFIMFIIAVLSYGLATFVPALLLGTKRGWKAGVQVIAYEIAWLLIVFLLLISILSSTQL